MSTSIVLAIDGKYCIVIAKNSREQKCFICVLFDVIFGPTLFTWQASYDCYSSIFLNKNINEIDNIFEFLVRAICF